MMRRKNDRFMIAALVGMVLTITLAACASLGFQTQSQKISATCAATGVSLQALAVARANGKLSPTVIAAVNNAVKTTEPICTAQPEPTLSQAEFSALSAAASQLASYAATNQEKPSQ